MLKSDAFYQFLAHQGVNMVTYRTELIRAVCQWIWELLAQLLKSEELGQKLSAAFPVLH